MSKGGKLNSICNKYFKKKKFCYLKIVVTCPIIQRHWLHSVLFADETAADSVVWERQMCFMKTLYLLSIWNFRHLIHSSATDVFSTTLWASSFSLSFFFYLYVLHHVSEALKKKNLFLFATIILAPLLVY